jgi:hypothetical protein
VAPGFKFLGHGDPRKEMAAGSSTGDNNIQWFGHSGILGELSRKKAIPPLRKIHFSTFLRILASVCILNLC